MLVSNNKGNWVCRNASSQASKLSWSSDENTYPWGCLAGGRPREGRNATVATLGSGGRVFRAGRAPYALDWTALDCVARGGMGGKGLCGRLGVYEERARERAREKNDALLD